MTVYFTADTHFGHANIINLCMRPFYNVEEMDAALIDNINSAVGTNDMLFHLGDFTLGSYALAEAYRKRIVCRNVFLIAGNHDKHSVRTAGLYLWAGSYDYKEVNVAGAQIVLSHYAFRTWNGIQRGALHLYGHSHGKLPGTRQSADVGVDAWNYKPVTLPEIVERMAE